MAKNLKPIRTHRVDEKGDLGSLVGKLVFYSYDASCALYMGKIDGNHVFTHPNRIDKSIDIDYGASIKINDGVVGLHSFVTKIYSTDSPDVERRMMHDFLLEKLQKAGHPDV